MAGVWSIPLPLEVALKFFGEDTLDSWNVPILHYLLEVALGFDKICSAVRQQVLSCPRKQAKRRNAIKNVSVLLSVTTSRWIALVVMQVNITICASFTVFRFNLIWNGPNISMVVLWNGGNPVATLRLGVCPIICSRGFPRCFRQTMHFLVRHFAIPRNPIIQNLCLASDIRRL